MTNHSKAMKQFNLDETRVDWHNKAMWHMRHKKNWELLNFSLKK